MVERQAEAIRDGEQTAAERHEAAVELEQTLLRQKQREDRGGRIAEQADGSDNAHEDGSNVVTAGEGFAQDASGVTIGSAGAGTDPSETQTSSGGATNAPGEQGVELEGDERTFEGEGRHSLEEQ